MSNKIDPPEANHPLTGIRRTGVVQDVVDAPATVNVFVGGDTTNLVPLPFIGMQPQIGATVIISFVGGDGVIIGVVPGGVSRIAYNSTAGTYSPSSGVDTKITDWSTLLYGPTDIVYSAGVFTLTPGTYHWDLTVSFPATTAAYRSRQLMFVNNTAVARGRASYQSPAIAAGAQDLTSGFTEDFPTGGTLQAAVNVSTAGVTGIQPQGIAIFRVG